MRINGSNEVNLNNINNLQPQHELVHDNQFQREGDFDEAFRASGVVGQSMVKPHLSLSESERFAKQFFSNQPKEISSEDANKLLKDFGFTNREISDFRTMLDNDKLFNELIRILFIYKESLDDSEEFNSLINYLFSDDYPKEDRYKVVDTLKVLNEENIKLFMDYKNVDRKTAIESLYGFFNEVLDSENCSEKVFAQCLELSDVMKEPIDYVVKILFKTEQPELFTKDRALAYKNICEALGAVKDYSNSVYIENPSDITPEFIEDYKNIINRAQEQNIQTAYNNILPGKEDSMELLLNPVRSMAEYKKILSKMEENNLDFSWASQSSNVNRKAISIEKANDILFNKNLPDGYLEKSSRLLKSLSPELKAKYPDIALNSLIFSNCLENIEDSAEFINKLAEVNVYHSTFDNLFDCIANREPEDFKKMTEVLQTFIDVGVYPQRSKSLPLLAESIDGTVDYDNEIKFIKELKNFYDTDDKKYSLKDFFENVVMTRFNYSKTDEYFKLLKENGLYGKVSPKDLKNIFTYPNGKKILNQIIKIGDNPIYKEYSSVFADIDEETLKKELDFFEDYVKDLNPEFSHLTGKELLQIVRGLSPSTIEDVNKKLHLGVDYNPGKYKISNHFNKDLFNLAELVYVRNAKNMSSSEQRSIIYSFANYKKGQDFDKDEQLKYVEALLKEGTSGREIISMLNIGYISEKEVKLHGELLLDAFANRDLLKTGLDDLSDDDVVRLIDNKEVVKVLRLLGKGTLEAAFALTEDGFNDVVKEMSEFYIGPENKEKLLQKINPMESHKYKILNNELTDLKEHLKELQQSKNFNKGSDEVKNLFSKIASKSKELKEFSMRNSDFQPQDILDKVRVLAVINAVYPQETERFIDLLQPSTPENDAIWERETNKVIYKLMGVEADDNLSKKLDLIHCKYLSKLAISLNSGRSFLEHSDVSFSDYMKKLVLLIKNNPDMSVKEAIDSLPQNILTKEQLGNIGIDYDKWTNVEPNSYLETEVELNAEESQKAAIESLEEDLNDPLFKKLPKDVQEQIFDALKSIDVTFEKSQKDNFDENGFSSERIEYYRLYKDGKPIKFSDMKKIVSKIKSAINANQFWTVKNKNPEIETARGTLYEHFIKLRRADVNNAKSLKDNEKVKLRISKTDMYNISKAIGLGNDGQCCTALGRKFNEYSAPTYIMNKCIGAIEIKDKDNFVGNTMIYIANVDEKPALVLDNIELKSKYQNNDKIRALFVDYAKMLCEEIGQPDLPIYAGPNRHKLDMSVFSKSSHLMNIVGSSGEDEIYIDYDAEPHIIGGERPETVELYQIR